MESEKFPIIKNPNLPMWKNPLSVEFDFGVQEDDVLQAKLRADLHTLGGNISRMVRAAEDEWYLKAIKEVLESKGFTVTKDKDHDI